MKMSVGQFMKKFLFAINDFNDPIWNNRSEIKSLINKNLFVHAKNETQARKLAQGYFKVDKMQKKTGIIDFPFLPFMEIDFVNCKDLGDSEVDDEKVEII